MIQCTRCGLFIDRDHNAAIRKLYNFAYALGSPFLSVSEGRGSSLNDPALLEYTNHMNKHKSHVDRKRNEYGNAMTKMRLSKMERLNKSAPLVEYNLESFAGKFEIYDPNKKKGRKNDIYI